MSWTCCASAWAISVCRCFRVRRSATVRVSGRYSLALRPGTVGTAVYRVYLPTQRPYYRVITPRLVLRVR